MDYINGILEKDYHFGFVPVGDRPLSEVPAVYKTQNALLRFSYVELYKLRKFFKKNGKYADFFELEGFDEDMFWENYDYLIDNLVVQLNALYPKDMVDELDITLEDYDIEWPEDLVEDVLNDSFLDWGAIDTQLKLERIELEFELEDLRKDISRKEEEEDELPY